MYDEDGTSDRRNNVDSGEDDDDGPIIVKQPGADSNVFDASPIASPRRHQEKRPDLFGSPVSATSPKRRLTGHVEEMRKRRFEEDNAGEYPMDFMQYMSTRKRMEPPRKLFPDDDTLSQTQHTRDMQSPERSDKEATEERRPRENIGSSRPSLLQSLSMARSQDTSTQEGEPVTMELTMEAPSLPSRTEQSLIQPLSMARSQDTSTEEEEPVTMELTMEAPSLPSRAEQSLIQPLSMARSQDTSTQEGEPVTMELTMEAPFLPSRAEPLQESRRLSQDDHTVTMELTQEMYIPPVKQPNQTKQTTMDVRTPQNQRTPNIPNIPDTLPLNRSIRQHDRSMESSFDQDSLRAHTSAIRELSNYSHLGSDYADQTIYLHEDTNVGDIFDEQFPEHYHSFTDEVGRNEPLSENMTMSEFIKIAGVTLAENAPLEERRRTSGFNSQKEPATRPKQVAAAAGTMPVLETYRTYCEKLKEKIDTSKETVAEIDNRVNETKPAIFAQYLEGDVQSRFQERLKLVKDYTSLKAKKDCLEWRNNFTQEVKELLKKNLEKIQKDRGYLRHFEDILNWNKAAITAYSNELQKSLEEARQKETSYKKIDQEELAKLQEELNEKSKSVQLLKGEADALERREFMCLERISSIERQKTDIKEAINKARKTRDTYKCVTMNDVCKAKNQLDTRHNLCGLRLVRQAGSVTEMTIGDDLSIVLDHKKLEQKLTDAVSIRVLEGQDQKLEAFVELVHGLQKLVRNKWNQTEIMRNVVIYWQRARSIRREIKKVQQYYWIEMWPLKDDNGDLDDRGLSIRIIPFCYVGKTKITLTFSIRPKDVMSYPAIDLSSLYVKLHYGHISFLVAERNFIFSVDTEDLVCGGGGVVSVDEVDEVMEPVDDTDSVGDADGNVAIGDFDAAQTSNVLIK
ncbi:hypothetical protein DFQ28_001048 [Apophysomyces sp. BC1034]|nr:hypothetical protein DFQ30_008886 [Apophysomyces sp. BC1015]KAG0191053.1 hypothetical protein DFQ28_001048 [Apophysomyces sp. BC1034]